MSQVKSRCIIDNSRVQVDLEYNPEERKIIRELAHKTAELAERPIEEKKKKLWYQHNALKPTRPLVFIDVENGWNEIFTEKDLKCENPLLKNWEMRLRKEIFWGEELKDDRVIQPYFDINYAFAEDHYGLEEKRIRVSEEGSFKYDPPLKNYEEDFDKLKQPQLKIYEKETEKIYELAQELLGDILEVRLKGNWWWTMGMTWDFISLRGLDQMMIDLYDNPEWVHRLMKFLQKCIFQKIDFLEEEGYLSLNNRGSYVGSGGFGWTEELPQKDFDPEQVRTIDMWGFAESQETTGISPDMFAEFIFPYQKEILKRFGLNCYGCCEPLDKRWHIVKNIPRLRRVSVSPWADRQVMSENLEQNYIYSLKPNPSPLSRPQLNEKSIRSQLRKVLEITQDNILEIIMKDNHTIGNNPRNPVRWVEIVREEIERIQ